MKKVLDQLEEHLIAVLICAMVVFETVNAVFHAAGAAQTGLPEELAIYCYIWIAFLSAAFCAKKGCDVAVNMLSDRYSANVRHLVKIVCAVINLAMSVCLLMGAFQFVTATAAAGNFRHSDGDRICGICDRLSAVRFPECTKPDFDDSTAKIRMRR